VWYVANESLNQIESITERHPELGARLTGDIFKVTKGTDTDVKNDSFIIDPGHWEARKSLKSVDLSQLKILNQRGYGKVQLIQFENKHWQLRVEGHPLFIRGLAYTPTPVGQHLNDYGNRWMLDDTDGDGKIDAPYESWVDKNKNNQQDPDEPAVGDFELMKAMGANAIRVYRMSKEKEYDPAEFNKEVLRDLHDRYGIWVIMGDFLGAYTIGSGASSEEGTDYTDPVQLESMRNSVKSYVTDHRSEPYVLLWLLGNENLMPADYSGVNATRTRASTQVEAYLRFVNEIAKMIHQIDPDHPVAVGNLDLVNLEEHAKFAPEVDVFGTNAYRSLGGFGNLWKTVQQQFDRPVLITEYGCDAYNSRTMNEDEDMQALYHEAAWKDIELHKGGGVEEEGNAIGGVIFEYADEWWKSNQGSWNTHEATKDVPMPFPDGWSSEEWMGLMSQGDGSASPFLRQPRKAYYLYRDKLWK
jgi:beta-glucuronidase